MKPIIIGILFPGAEIHTRKQNVITVAAVVVNEEMTITYL